MHFDFLSCFRVSKINMASANGEMSVTEPSDTEIAEEVKILDDNEVPLTPDTAAEEARKEEIRLQITKIEEEIVTLNQALERKERQLGDLRSELGITTWTQFRDGFSDRYHALQTTSAYQKTSDTIKDWNDKIVHSNAYNKLSVGALATKSVLSDAGQKTATAAKTMGSATAKKLGEIRESSYFQSIGTRVKSASSSFRFKMLRSPGRAPPQTLKTGDTSFDTEAPLEQ